MGFPHIFCSICGGSLEVPQECNEVIDGPEWLEDLRLFALPSSLPRHELKGRNKKEGPPEPSPTEQPCFVGPIHWWEPGIFSYEQGEYVVFYEDIFGNIVFPMHTAYGDIIARVVRSRNQQGKACSLRVVYNVLCRKREEDFKSMGSINGYGEQGLEWQHNYYGARGCWDYDWWDADQESHEVFLADPLKIPYLTTGVLNLLRASPSPQPLDTAELTLSKQPVSQRSASDRLAALPRELFDRVCDFLPSASLIELRLSCRTFASYIKLNQRFFLMLLLNGMEFPFLWDLDASACLAAAKQDQWDWKGLTRTLSHVRALVNEKPQELNMPVGLWNRMRIWLIVDEALQKELKGETI